MEPPKGNATADHFKTYTLTRSACACGAQSRTTESITKPRVESVVFASEQQRFIRNAGRPVSRLPAVDIKSIFEFVQRAIANAGASRTAAAER